MTGVAFLLDVDNTLINNDKVKTDLEERVVRYAGPDTAPVFWQVYEQVRRELDYVDLPLTLNRFRAESPEVERFAELSAAVLFYPFEECLYPRTLEVIEHLREIGTVAIVSDGDPVFQPAKIARAGLAAAVDDRVLIYVHKEQQLDDVRRRIPAGRYVIVDDKPNILVAVKRELGDRAVAIHVRQGRYARETGEWHADIEIDSIADLMEFQLD